MKCWGGFVMECVKIWAGLEPCLGGRRASKVFGNFLDRFGRLRVNGFNLSSEAGVKNKRFLLKA